jgi:hypothetical protein
MVGGGGETNTKGETKMKQIGTTTEGGAIVEMTNDDIARMDAAIKQVECAMQRMTLLMVFGGQPEAPATPVRETTTRAEDPPIPPKVRPSKLAKTKVPKKAKVVKAGRGRNSPRNWKNDLVAVMTGKGAMPVADIAAAYANGKGIAPTKDIVKSIGKSLPSNKDVFERTARAVYRLRDTPAVQPAAAQDMSIFNSDPAKLDDDQLSRRLHQAKQLGRCDAAGRMEFIKRKAQA